MGYPQLGSDSGIVADVLGWGATLATLYLFSSPVTVVRRVLRERSTLEYSPTPYVISLFNCLLWTSYCFFIPGRLPALVTNIFGVVVQTGYAVVFLAYGEGQKRKFLICQAVLVVVAFAALIGAAVVVGGSDNKKRGSFIGIAADVLNGMMYASPLSVIGLVIRTKSVEFMPLGLSIGTLVTSLMWASYALWVGDIYIALPNNAGVLLGIAQVGVYAFYARSARSIPERLLEVDNKPGANQDCALNSTLAASATQNGRPSGGAEMLPSAC